MTETEAEKKPIKKRIVKWLVILVIISAVGGFLGFKFLLPFIDDVKEDLGEITVAEYNPSKTHEPVFNELPSVVVEIKEPPVPLATETIPEVAAPVVPVQDNLEVAQLKQNQKYFVLYLAAKDLREARNDPKKFAAELQYFSNLALSVPELSGKVDMLKLADNGGMPSIDSLKNSLKDLAKDLESREEKGFWEGIKNSLASLVKVTKVRGDAEDESVYSISKRAEIALDNNNLNEAIAEVQKFGKPAETWVRQAGNLQRVYEITDFLVDYARNNIKV